MDTTALAQIIATKVAADTSFWIAVVGFLGVLVGAIITVAGNLLLHWIQSRRRTALDAKRTKLLEQMLRDSRFNEHWRRLDTLSRVIGADRETTTQLLVELGARGSEKDDGLWGLLEYHPLDESEK